MKEIQLSQGFIARVDDADFDWLSQWSWHVLLSSPVAYAKRCELRDGKRCTVLMHREILGFPDAQIDHIDFDGLNNQRANLRTATQSQNCIRKPKIRGLSRFKGVSRAKSKWLAEIFCRGMRHRIGLFVTQEAAALAYNSKAKELFGEFAFLNTL